MWGLRFCPQLKSKADARSLETNDGNALLIVLLGGEAGLRCGEMIALRWDDIDLVKRQLRVERSDVRRG